MFSVSKSDKMDPQKLAELLRATIDPIQRAKAEEQLNQIYKIIGFGPRLMQVVMSSDVELPVRQAGVIYLKNFITGYWVCHQAQNSVKSFGIHEQDKAVIRESIVDATVHAPDKIKTYLALSVNTIVKYDFPDKWPQIVDKVNMYLRSPDASLWPGALMVLYQFAKHFEYVTGAGREPLHKAMVLFLPVIYQICLRLLPDSSEQSVSLQKQILKLFYAFIQNTLPLNIVSKESFTQWMDIVRQVADRPVPAEVDNLKLDDDDRAHLPWWKCKKWALNIIHRMFERYGSPGTVSNEYKDFSAWYLKTFSGGIIEVLLKILDSYRRKFFVSPRVLQQTLSYLDQAVSHAHTWKFLKPHMFEIVRDVLFPIMSHTEEDEEMYEADPQEYIKVKFDPFHEFVSHVRSAECLLHSACKKRKDMLPKTIQFCVKVLTNTSMDHAQKDGVLYMIGALVEVMLKKSAFKDQMDKILLQYVLPEFNSPHGHLRARACWTLYHFSNIKFTQEAILVEAVKLITNALLNDQDLPVQAQAAIALQRLLQHHDRVQGYVEPWIKEITLKLLDVIRMTENEELTTVMQKIVCVYQDKLMPIAVEMCNHMTATFCTILGSNDGNEDRAVTAMGLLNSIETLLGVMEDQPEIIAQLQPTVLQIVGPIFTQNIMEFYEEAFSLVCDLTCKTISEVMWKVLELMYEVFLKDGFDFFTDMMPALHNFITVDTKAFISNQNHILAMFNMCKAVMAHSIGEDPECHAAKLLEVIILQCKGRIDSCIPSFIQLALERLTREIKTSELRTMCLQVIIAALLYNPNLCLQVMERLQVSLGLKSSDPLASHFIKQWISDTDCFFGLHDRKLSVIGWCTLISLGPSRPQVLNEIAHQIIPALIILFEGLQRAYVAKLTPCHGLNHSNEESDLDETVLSSDENEVEEEDNRNYTKKGSKAHSHNNNSGHCNRENHSQGDYGDEDKENAEYDEDDDEIETLFELYSTPLDTDDRNQDEFILFKEVMQNIERTDAKWYHALTSQLTRVQRKILSEIVLMADQCKAALESKRIERSGGYMFTSQAVPTTFNFGGQPAQR